MTTLSEKKSKRMQVDFSNPYPPPPKEAFFDLNNTCNSKCYFCSNRKIGKRFFLDKKLGFRLLKEFFDFGTREISLFATGEPFMRNDFVDFVREAKRIGFEYIFIDTNGILATPDKAKPVLEAGLDSIKFSVNAPTKSAYKQVHGVDCFDQVIENIKWFHRYRKENNLSYKIYLSMVISSMAEGDWNTFCEMISPYVDDLNWRSCSNQGGNKLENNMTEKIDKDNLLGSLKKNQYTGKCPDLFFRCTVTPQGYLSACVVDYQNFLIVGDLNKSHIKDLWHSQTYVDLRKKHIEGKVEGLICNSCLNNCQEKAEPLMPQFAIPFENKNKGEEDCEKTI